MTEAQWLAVTEPHQMLSLLGENPDPRKLRLFACACCRVVWTDKWPDTHRKLVPLIEEFVEGTVSIKKLTTVWLEALKPMLDSIHEGLKAYDAAGNCSGLSFCRIAAGEDQKLIKQMRFSAWALTMKPDRKFKTAAMQCFRDIFPFRPVGFVPIWRTDTVLSLARQMYDSRDFSAMPILADALQDAGCGNERVLSHCRADGPHARGCWVVDAILGK